MPSQRTKYSKFSWGRTPKPPFRSYSTSTSGLDMLQVPSQCTKYSKFYFVRTSNPVMKLHKFLAGICFKFHLSVPNIQNFLGGGPPNPPFRSSCTSGWDMLQMPSQCTKYSKFSFGRTPNPLGSVSSHSSVSLITTMAKDKVRLKS